MSPDFEVLYPRESRDEPFGTRLGELAERAGEPCRFSLDDRLAAMQALSDALLAGEVPGLVGAAFLAAFLRGGHLRQLLEREIPDLGAFDRFVALEPRKSLKLEPRGLVAQWIAGNVPLLGMFSWAISALLGNANVLRLSSRREESVSALVGRLAGLSDCGRWLAERTLLVSFDRENQAAHQAMSMAADVRVAWGGQEAVETIRRLPCRWDCEDVAFGPRVSYAAVDPALASDSILNRLATDVAYFDQLACSSPQCIFVRGRSDDGPVVDFVARFSEAFRRQAANLGRHPLDFAESYQIELDRTRVLLGGGALRHDAGTQWTVALVAQPQTDLHCVNRFVQVMPVASIEAILPLLPRNVQTVVTLLGPAEHEAFSTLAARRGVCRFPRPGEGNNFELPWDGLALVPRLLHWVVRSEPRPAGEEGGST